MSDPKLQQIHAWLKEHEPQLLEDNREMLRIPSVESEPVEGGPFGQANKDALMFALQLADKYGFKTKNMEGYIGYGEVGQGEKMVMSLGHLDVVPVSDGWHYPPFGAEIDGDYLYARGSCDDKGPTMASLYAIRAIKECMPDLGVRIRQVFGCNEESGFKCVEHYVANEEAPTMGIAPDSMWPLVYAEKGIMNLDITVPLPAAEGFKVLEIHGGSRPNIVIDSCEAQIDVSSDLKKGVEDVLTSYWDKNMTHSWNGNTLTLRAAGKACHGSTPWEGDSAAVRLFRCIWEIAPLSLSKMMRTLVYMGHPSGVGPGIYGHDEPTQDLTANLGIVGTDGGNLTLLINVRYPVTWKGEDLEKRCRDHLATHELDFNLRIARDAKGLYFPLDHPLVQTAIEAYAMETGKTLKPQSMGGGTYARAVPNTVSIGAAWDEDGDGKAHENDERMKVENLFKISRIYANVLYKLVLLNS